MANPLDAFVTKKTPRNLRLPDMPKYAAMAAPGSGLSSVFAKIDEANQKWKQEVERQIAALAVSETTTTTVTTAAAAPPVVASSPDSGLKNEVDALSDELNQHIQSHVVHGTQSPVVGQTDEEGLEAKTIGFAQPRNAKFRHVLSYSAIDNGEQFLIPANFNMIVAGPFTVTGELTIEGAFASVNGP